MLLATSGHFIGHEDIFGPVIKQIIVWIYGTTFAKNEKENGRRVLKVYQLSVMLCLVPFMQQSELCTDVLLKIDYILF